MNTSDNSYGIELSAPHELLSASFKRFLQDTAKIRNEFPEPEQLSQGQRKDMYAALHGLNTQAPIREFGDGITAYDSSARLTECHYAGAFIDRLQEMELTEGSITPGKTTLVEVSSGSAGVAFLSIGQLLGYNTEIAIPPLEPARQNAITEIISALRTGRILSSTEDDIVTDNYLNDAIGRMKQRALSREGRKELKAGLLALPNHAEVPITPQSFASIAKDALQKHEEHTGKPPRIVVMALGNGTTCEGMNMVLRDDKQYNNTQLFGFEGRHNPGVYQTLWGPMSDEEKEDRVTLYGADGSYNLTNFAKGFSSINRLLERGVLSKETTTTVSRDQWEQVFEEVNIGTNRRDTLGRTSCAALHYARILREQYDDILFFIYDKADRYGDYLINQEVHYEGNGQWHRGIKLVP